jgi:hypothetical protein
MLQKCSYSSELLAVLPLACVALSLRGAYLLESADWCGLLASNVCQQTLTCIRCDAAGYVLQLRMYAASSLQEALAAHRTRQRADAAAAAVAAAAVDASHGVVVRLLTEGMPTRQQALQAQRANLDRFLQDNALLFAAMPYIPWTRSSAGFRAVKVRIAPSYLPGARNLGLLGVVLEEDVRARSTEQPILLYPGLLMTETLHDLFVTQYHCPTALELPALTWTDAQGEEQNMLVVGDPTSPGAVVNDGVKSGKHGTIMSTSLIIYTQVREARLG